jgi:glycosyltransferase involved in cell wall biosynthesis
MADVDILIPVYNEGDNIVEVLDGLAAAAKTPLRILICYDNDDDDTLDALKRYDNQRAIPIETVKNQTSGVLGAIRSGFAFSDADHIIVLPADDTFNGGIIDEMVRFANDGCDIVVASRFVKGGCMKGCPLLKAFLVRSAAFTLRYLGGLPARDASNGFRLFSKKLLDAVEIESGEGWVFSIELLVKCHRLGWRIGETPAQWHERTAGKSRFRLFKWLPGYLKWYFYAFATTYLRRKNVLRKQT